MEFRQEVNDIASRDTTLGVLANQIVSSYDNGNYMTCFFGISVLEKNALRQATDFEGRMDQQEAEDAVVKLIQNGTIDDTDGNNIISMSLLNDFAQSEDIHAPALLGEEKVIDFNSEEIWKQMVEQFISQMIPVCKKLICR